MVTIRSAVPSDREALARYGAALMRQHHDADPKRFLLTDHPEAGYGRFLVSQLDDQDVCVRVAEVEGRVIGYVFASIEPLSWRDLRGPCGFVHDIYVDAAARQRGAGRALLTAASEWIRSRGQTQIVLWSKSGNATAQRLFAANGFRPTMVEMTQDTNLT